MKNLHNYIKVIFFISVLSITFAQNADHLLKKSDGLRAKDNVSSKLNLSISLYKKESLFAKSSYEILYKNHNKTLIKQTLPKDKKGDLILMLDYNMWSYSPGNRAAIRITPQQKLLGGASNTDIAKLGYSHDYNAQYIQKDTLNNTQCHLLLLTANSKKLAYQKIKYWINSKNYMPVKAEFLTLSDKVFKTALYSNYKSFFRNDLIPTKIVIKENLLKKDQKTVIEYSSLKNVNIPVKYFNINYLKKIR